MQEILTPSEVSFFLKTLKIGVNDEFATCTRRPCVSLGCHENANSHVNSILISNDIEIITTSDNCILFECNRYYDVIALLTAENYGIKEKIHSHLIDFILNFQVHKVEDAEIIEKVGELWHKLKPYQKDDVRIGVSLDAVYLSMEMGLGKTICFLARAQFWKDNWPFLVICPRTLAHTWTNEIKQWVGEHVQIVIIESSKQLQKPLPKHDVLIVSYSLIRKDPNLQVLKNNYQIIVADESHNFKTRTAKQTLGAMQLFPTAKYKVLMSGTPFEKPSEMFSQIKLLYPDMYPKFHTPGKEGLQYAVQYCEPKKVRFGGMTQWEFNGYDNGEELGAMLSLFMIRQTKEEVLKFLPPKIRSCIILDPLTKAEYKEIEKEKGKEKKTWGPEQLEVKTFDFMESFRLTCTYKIPHVLKFIQEYLLDDLLKNDPSLKVLIFFHHQNMREQICELLTNKQISHFSIHGGTKRKNRDEFQDDFQKTDKFKIGVLSLKACNSGFTFTKSSTIFFAEILFGMEMSQSESRSHRIGQTKIVQIFYLLSPRTTDEIQWKIIQKKDREMTRIIDGEAREMKGKRIQSREISLDTMQLGKKLHQKADAPRIKFVTKRMMNNSANMPLVVNETSICNVEKIQTQTTLEQFFDK